MIEIILDGKKMKTREKAHLHIKDQLISPEYHGNNLDALWDVISSYDMKINIELINKRCLMENLGDYGQSIIDVLEDGEKENSNINFSCLY